MKELSIEQKAKAYDEALERAKKWYNAPNVDKIPTFGNRVIEEIFPELAGSKDERIRKWLIGYFHQYKEDGMEKYANGLKVESIISWLEKQDPKKHEEELEKAYKTADKVQYRRGYEDATKEMEKQGESYTKRDVDNAYIEGMAFAKNELEKQAEVVSDKDDIEAEEKGIRKAFNKIWEEKQDKQKSQRMISAEAKETMYDKPADTVEPKCEESKTKIFDAPTPFEDKLYAFVAACEFLTLPAKIEFIKEHSQELLDAAKEQIEKKELKKIDARENLTLDGDLMEADCMIVEQKSWSEEDKNFMYDTLSNLTEIKDRYGEGYGNVGKCIDWVKALKQRIGG